MNLRIGHGFDVHRFAEPTGEPEQVTLATLPIAHDRALLAHSDGDVLVHALCDALLGACALGDIGEHFPDTDPQYAGASGAVLLAAVLDSVTAAGYRLINTDLTVLAETPKVNPHRTAMRTALAEHLELPVSAVSIKATTTEGLGAIGRREGIACHAVVLLAGLDDGPSP